VQAARAPEAYEVRHFSGTLRFAGLDHPLITRLANPVLATYWRALAPLLPSLRRAAAADRERPPHDAGSPPRRFSLSWSRKR
jgi:hypothetical protein